MKPPGPTPVETLRLLRKLGPDPMGALNDLADSFGDIVRVNAGPMLVLVISDPEMTRYVLQDNYANYRKSAIYDDFSILLGEGQLTTNDMKYWRAQRKLIHPAFSRSHVQRFATDITESTAAMLDRWDAAPGEYRDIYADYVELLVTVIGRILFSLDLSTDTRQVTDAMETAFAYIMKRVNSPVKVPRWLPTPASRNVSRRVGDLDEVVRRLIDERRHGTDQGDLLTNLVRARDEDGNSMSEENLLNEVKTLLVAGHESPANALSWALHLLAANPEVEARLVTEIQEVLGDRTPTFADLRDLEYTRMVIDETMRLYPPAWLVERSPLEDDTIGGYTVPAGARISMFMHRIHHDERLWDNPLQFRPERFTPEEIAQRPRFAYFPFSGGPRTCLGKDMALSEMVLILAMTLQRFRFEPDKTHPVVPLASVNLRPRYGIRMMPVRRATRLVQA
ncbi:cytochrome P450 [Nocardia sp. NPDC020380]|uniref:cytochrome P450 n=1 Tax=Nocardia sp. NPDC020380 TaxID=3364309 RepID=UPI0037A98E12